MKRFGASVRCQREKVGLSQEKLAELANVHRTYISGMERGLQNISLLTMIKLAKALSVELDKLLSDI
ncbi:hypothetical protein AWY79_06430 [Pseudodesulfovibrio indicus]|uniref:HTH cro/C1-type domain-containing protein n=2 Tax=Pseudodesulfovibrio indicus TaxID=1716143 RepID=A0ABN4M3Q6_9BACT|nr:hypothetical protein AWY79_06430 [Pseudodesulfovibrio indicus]